jgi:hypothetical protein
METIENAIKCSLCKGVLESPVFLPCSDSICKRHVMQGAQELLHCLECDTIHAVPASGFPENKALTKILNAKIQKAKYTPEYTSAFESIRQMATVLDEFKLFHKDPFYFINKTIGELKRETDLMRDEFKLKIDLEADDIMQELDKYELDCKTNLNSVFFTNASNKRAADLSRKSAELASWQKTLACFESSEAEWKLIREKSDNYKNELQMELRKCEDEFLLNKLANYGLKLISFCKIELESERK